MAMTPLERKAALRAAVTLRELTMAEAAAELGVSYNHLTLVISGERVGSERLEEPFSFELLRCAKRRLTPARR